MNTSAIKPRHRTARAVGLVIGAAEFIVSLDDGRRIAVPFSCFPLLEQANWRQRAHFEVHADGRMLRWPDIDEDIEVQHLVEGRMPVRKGGEFMAVAEAEATYGEDG